MQLFQYIVKIKNYMFSQDYSNWLELYYIFIYVYLTNSQIQKETQLFKYIIYI